MYEQGQFQNDYSIDKAKRKLKSEMMKFQLCKFRLTIGQTPLTLRSIIAELHYAQLKGRIIFLYNLITSTRLFLLLYVLIIILIY